MIKKMIIVTIVAVIIFAGIKLIPPVIDKVEKIVFLNQIKKHQTYDTVEQMQSNLQGDWVLNIGGRPFFMLSIKDSNCTGHYLTFDDDLEMSFDVTWNPSKGTFTWLTDDDIYIVAKGARKLIEYQSGNEYIRQ